jgi:hypothetical protein
MDVSADDILLWLDVFCNSTCPPMPEGEGDEEGDGGGDALGDQPVSRGDLGEAGGEAGTADCPVAGAATPRAAESDEGCDDSPELLSWPNGSFGRRCRAEENEMGPEGCCTATTGSEKICVFVRFSTRRSTQASTPGESIAMLDARNVLMNHIRDTYIDE